jgi:hypothetical protein
MQADHTEYVMRLCEEVTHEQKPARLLALVKQINELLEKDRSECSGTIQSASQFPSIRDLHHV